jgi:hypothetical protein
MGHVGNWVLKLFYCLRVEILVWMDVEGEMPLCHEQMFLGKGKRHFSLWIIATIWEHVDIQKSDLQMEFWKTNNC